jgi:transcription termination/antitermination protein NusA
MSRIYNAESLKIMTLFEKITRTRIKDYFIDDNNLQTFVVDEIVLGKAIGKQAVNVKKLQKLLNSKIRIVGFSNNPEKFTKNLIYPLKAEIELKENIILIKSTDTKTKAFLIGRNQVNLKNNLKILKKYFKNIEDLKVI